MAKVYNISGSKIDDQGIVNLIDYATTSLSDDYMLVVGCSPYFSDVDTVLITPSKVYAIEVKNWKGDIVAKSYGQWLKDGKPINNPVRQTRNNAVALANWLKERTNNNNLWVDGLLVFTHKDCNLDLSEMDSSSYKGVKIFTMREIKSLLEKDTKNGNKTDDIKEIFVKIDAESKEIAAMKKETTWRIWGFIIFLVIVLLLLIQFGIIQKVGSFIVGAFTSLRLTSKRGLYKKQITKGILRWLRYVIYPQKKLKA